MKETFLNILLICLCNIVALRHRYRRLCAAVDEQNAVVVYNHAFAPREYLREKIYLQLVNFMRTCVAQDDKAGERCVVLS